MNIRGLERLGLPGVAGIGCLLFSLAFYFGGVAPAEERLVSLNAERQQLKASVGASRSDMPAMADLTEVLKRLAEVAERNRIVIENMTYAVTDAAGGRRIEVSFPLKAGYPLLRAYLRDALALAPMASLDELTLQRLKADDVNVDAQVRLSYGFSASS